MTEVIHIEEINNPSWMPLARCKDDDADPAWFVTEGKKNNHDAKNAKAICDTCNVKQKCLEWIIDIEASDGSVPGIYGGTTQQERRDLRLCMFKGCNEPVKKINTKPHAQNNFCSVEHQKENERLRIKRAKEKELNTQPVDYYMKGIVHG